MTDFIERINAKIFPSLKIKFLVAFFILIFTPLVILTIITNGIVSENYENQIFNSADKSFEQAQQFLEFKVDALLKASDIVYLNKEIQIILSRENVDIETDLIQQYKDALYLDNMMFSLKNNSDVFRIKLYVNDTYFFSAASANYRPLSQFKESEKYKILEESDELYIWYKPDDVIDDTYSGFVSVVPMMRKVYNSEDEDELTGIVEIQMLEENVNDIITNANITSDGVVFLNNSRNELISASDKNKLNLIDIDLEDVKPTDYLTGSVFKESNWDELTIHDEVYLMRTQPIEDTDWELVALVPYKELVAPSVQIQRIMVILLFVLGAVAFVIALLFTDNITKRVRKLTDSMIDVQNGKLHVWLEGDQSDEIGQLYESYNYMIERISVLINQQYEDGKNIKNAELKALQAQINPHFLYNTLDLINWKAMDKGADEIVQLSQALAKFYKLSLSKGKDLISLRDELQHVEQYVKIQNMRFDNRINYKVTLDEALLECEIPKIVLQPIIENSIVHGILKKRNQEGNIQIDIMQNNGNLIISVKDNGVGIDAEILPALLLKSNTQESHGYGIKNIHERLQLLYGKDFGLRFKSSTNAGTTVIMKLPIIFLTDDTKA